MSYSRHVHHSYSHEGFECKVSRLCQGKTGRKWNCPASKSLSWVCLCLPFVPSLIPF